MFRSTPRWREPNAGRGLFGRGPARVIGGDGDGRLSAGDCRGGTPQGGYRRAITGDNAIDWECAGDGDPASDLACYPVGAMLDRAGEARLIGAYLGSSRGRHESSSIADRMVLWKRVIAAVWLAWASTLTGQHDRPRWMAWAPERAEHEMMAIASVSGTEVGR